MSDQQGAVALLMGFPREAVVPQSSLRPGDRVHIWKVTEGVVAERTSPNDPIYVTATAEHGPIITVFEAGAASGERAGE